MRAESARTGHERRDRHRSQRSSPAELGIAHGVAAIFHHHRLVFVTLHVGQRPRKQRGLHFGGGGDVRHRHIPSLT